MRSHSNRHHCRVRLDQNCLHMLRILNASITFIFSHFNRQAMIACIYGNKEDCGIIKSSCFKNLWSFYCSSEPALNLQNASLLGGPWKHKDKHDPHKGWRDLRCKYRNTTEKPNGIQNSSSPKPADPVLGRGHHWVTSQFREMCIAHLDCPRQSHFSRELLKPELKLQWRIMLFSGNKAERGVSRQKTDS